MEDPPEEKLYCKWGKDFDTIPQESTAGQAGTKSHKGRKEA